MDRSNRCNPSEERLISFVIDSSGGFHSSTDESNMHPNVPSPSDILTQEKSAFHYKAIVYVLIALFGLGTWTNLAGVWIELPLIVPVLPESWQLPAKLALIINSANVFPILLVFATLIFKLNTAPFEVPVNFVLLCVSITFAVGFALLWNKTASLFGTEQSFYLMVLCFLTAIADCMSSTTFIPFLHRYEPAYLNAYFAGEALTSLLPALLGVTQGVGVSECVPSFDALTNTSSIEISYQPQFSVRTYFLLLSCLPLSALVAFSTLRCMRTGRLKTQSAANRSGHHQSRVFILMENISDIPSIEQTIETIEKIEERLRLERKQEKLPIQTQLRRFAMSEAGVFLLIVFQCSAMLYGACQGLTTFSLNAYSVNTFHYTIIISQFAYPVTTLIGAFLPEVSSKVVYFLYALTVGLFVYIVVTATMSPCPPFVNLAFGHVLIFLVWICIYFTCSALRILMGHYFRKHLGHRGLVWFGMATQIGALLGALVVFILTNSFQLFHERNLCDPMFSCF